MNKTITKSKVNKAGEILRENPKDKDAIETLRAYRSVYYSIAKVFFNILADETTNVYRQAIVVWRMKRVKSIVSKLHRNKDMKLARMEDIVGCRCIMQSEEQVYKVYESLKKNPQISIKESHRDYIKEPKSDGYRSLHIACSLPSFPNYYIEVQLRTQEQHNWATLVETTDALYPTKIKESNSAPKYEKFPRFHLLLSRPQLAFIEIKELIDIALEYDYLKRVIEVFALNDLQIRDQWKKLPVNGQRLILISTSPEGKASIESFRRIDDAENAHFQKHLLEEEKNNVIISSRNISFEMLNSAYGNYTLNYNNLFYQIYQYISDICLYFYSKGDIALFRKYYKEFLKMTVMMLQKAHSDKVNFNVFESEITFQKNKSIRKRQAWWASVKKHYAFITDIFNTTHSKFDRGGIKGVILKYIRIIEYSHFASIISNLTKSVP